jgi:hypothetical protein
MGNVNEVRGDTAADNSGGNPVGERPFSAANMSSSSAGRVA